MYRSIEVECFTCKKKFLKRECHIHRTDRLKKHHCCSLSCAASYGNKILPKTPTDQYSPFRYFIQRAGSQQRFHKNKKFKKFDITLEFLLALWKRQKGICPYSKKKMILPMFARALRNSPLCASLDRINPSKGYTQDNVQFTTQFVNLGKCKYNSREIMKFFG